MGEIVGEGMQYRQLWKDKSMSLYVLVLFLFFSKLFLCK